MTVRDDLSVDWWVSPRIITIAAPSTEITIQDLVDTLRDIEDEPGPLAENHLIDAAGKEDLGGGVLVGITAELQNAKVAFEARSTPVSEGTATTAYVAGTVLTDISASFQSDGVAAGDAIINLTDGSAATVRSVDSETQITHEPLAGGTQNDWDIGEEYNIYDLAVCNISGGNLVAVDSGGSSMDPVLPTFGVYVVRTSSSSATLQEQEALQFASYGGGVTVDVVNGQSGTAYPIGNQEYPVDNVQDAVAIATARGFDVLYIIGDITLDTGDNIEGFTLIGQNPVKSLITINSGAQTLGCEFNCASVEGTLDGNSLLRECKVLDLNYVEGCIESSMLAGTVTLAGTADTQFVKCWDGLPGSGVPTIDLGGSGRNLGVWGWHGGLKLQNKDGSDSVSVNMDSGRLVLDSTVTAGTVLVKGVGLLEDNSVGASVDSTGLTNPASVADAVWDEALADHRSDGSVGQTLRRILFRSR